MFTLLSLTMFKYDGDAVYGEMTYHIDQVLELGLQIEVYLKNRVCEVVIRFNHKRRHSIVRFAHGGRCSIMRFVPSGGCCIGRLIPRGEHSTVKFIPSGEQSTQGDMSAYRTVKSSTIQCLEYNTLDRHEMSVIKHVDGTCPHPMGLGLEISVQLNWLTQVVNLCVHPIHSL